MNLVAAGEPAQRVATLIASQVDPQIQQSSAYRATTIPR
jgi:hypothetical protein